MAWNEFKGYNGAPYNFVGISNKVYKKDSIQPHNKIEKEKKSGTIRYEITAETPIFVGSGKKEGEPEEFYRDCYGKYAVPGSTVRGLVRGNVQILSCSSVKDDIQDGYLMYRNVAKGKEKKYYNYTLLGNKPKTIILPDGSKSQISVLQNVRAGYIRNTGNGYVILKTKADVPGNKKINYEILSERKIMESRYKGFEYLREINLQNVKDCRFKKEIRNKRVHYKGKMNREYEPYYTPVSYKIGEKGKVTAVAEPGKLTLNGYLLSSGNMNEKKAFYLIPEIDETREEMVIPQSDIDSFKRDYEGRKTQVEAMSKDFFKLPEKGEVKPVFYIHLHGRLYFGFTPRLRVFYEKRILEGLGREQNENPFDYSKSLFGFADDKESYKSRVSFLDAVISQEDYDRRTHSVLLLGPKPTSYLDYLVGKDGRAASYNDDFRLRGVKQYWLKKRTVAEEHLEKAGRLESALNTFEKGVSFCGEIRFSNLTDEELGMLLWGLLLEKDSQQNIGKGKPYGYGRISVKLLNLEILNNQELYGGESLCLQPYTEEKEKKEFYINAAKADMTNFLGRDIMKVPQIRDFFLMKDSTQIPANERTRYMSLDNREYSNRENSQEILPSVEAVIKGKKNF